MKHSQMYGQVFIYVLSLVVISAVVYYGYSSVTKFQGNTDKISCLKLKSDLSAQVNSMISDYGSVKKYDILMCSKFTKICFAETYLGWNKNNLPASIDPVMKDYLSSNAENNAFLVEDVTKDSFYAGNISVTNNILCVNSVGGKAPIRLESFGDHVLISKWN